MTSISTRIPGTCRSPLPTVVRTGRGSGMRARVDVVELGERRLVREVHGRLDDVRQPGAAGGEDRGDVVEHDARVCSADGLAAHLRRSSASIGPQPLTKMKSPARMPCE